MLLLTNERTVNADLTVTYSQGRPTAKDLGPGPESGTFPAGTRDIRVQFYSAIPGTTLQYAVFLGRNGAEKTPIGSAKPAVLQRHPGAARPGPIASRPRPPARSRCSTEKSGSTAAGARS